MNMTVLSFVVLLLAVAVFLPAADRLRHINWKTTKAEYVVLHLGLMFWSLGAASDALTSGDVPVHYIAGLTTMWFWLYASSSTWVNGAPPEHARKQHANDESTTQSVS